MDERKDEDRPMVSISGSTFIQCFDTNSGWVAGRTSNPKKLVCHLLALSAQYVGSIYASLGRLSKVCCCSPCWQEILIDCCNSGGQMRVVPHCQHTQQLSMNTVGSLSRTARKVQLENGHTEENGDHDLLLVKHLAYKQQLMTKQ